MSSEFLNYTQTNSETSDISAEPSADPAHFKADALVVFLESDGLRGPLIEIDKSTGGLTTATLSTRRTHRETI